MLLLPLSSSSALTLGLGLALGFLDGVVFLGCEATRPLFSGVPVMKTRSLSYPSQVLPLLMQFWQKGRSLLHCFLIMSVAFSYSVFLVVSFSISPFLYLSFSSPVSPSSSSFLSPLVFFLCLIHAREIIEGKQGTNLYSSPAASLAPLILARNTNHCVDLCAWRVCVCMRINACISRPVFGPRSL